MHTRKFILTIAGFIFFNMFLLHSYAETTGAEAVKLANSITSVKVAKSMLRDTLIESDDCPVGSCFNNATTYICEIVAALDVKVSGVIIGEMTGDKPNFVISTDDLRHMKELFAQCKPTNYQYWNYNTPHSLYKKS